MGLFKRKKKKKDMDAFFESLMPPEEPEGQAKGQAQKPQMQQHQAEHEALAHCEQIMNAARQLEEVKNEYRLVTNYLKDIQTIEELPPEKMNQIVEVAQNVVTLNKSRDSYSKKEKKISDAQYNQMEQMESEMPDNIRRLQDNENYQSMVKRDMDYLEGEKGEWHYYAESVMREQKLLKKGVWVIAILFVLGVSALWVVSVNYHRDMMMPLLLTVFAGAFLGGGAFLRIQYNERELKRAEANSNRAITLQNQMKAKYVNATNAVDYACEKFHVRNSMELNFIWSQYLEEAKEREKLEKANEDLEYFKGRLVREMKKYNLYDSAVWVPQAFALVDKKEMVELKHYLFVRRQKLRERLETQIKEIQEAKRRILVLLKDKREYRKEIVEVLKSVDKMCGIKK